MPCECQHNIKALKGHCFQLMTPFSSLPSHKFCDVGYNRRHLGGEHKGEAKETEIPVRQMCSKCQQCPELGGARGSLLVAILIVCSSETGFEAFEVKMLIC